MKEFNYEGINIFSNFDLEEEEMFKYVDHISKAEDGLSNVAAISLSLNKDGYIDLTYDVLEPKFERIRRITGYLSGTTDRWNNAKQAEEKDRVKHI